MSRSYIPVAAWPVAAAAGLAVGRWLRLGGAPRRHPSQRPELTQTAVAVLLDASGRLISADSSWHNLTGQPRTEAVGHGWLKVIHPGDHRALARYWTQEGAKIDAKDVRLWHAASRDYRTFLLRKIPWPGTKPGDLKWIVTMTDIHDRTLADQILQDERKHLRELSDSMPQMVWTARADGFINYHNRRWHEFTKIPDDSGHHWRDIVHPDDVQGAVDHWYDCVQSGKPYQAEMRMRDRSGGYRWFLARATPIIDESGQVARWHGTCTDINDLKNAEEEIRKLNSGLETRVKDRTKKLTETVANLEAFSYTVSHDLRAPLRHLQGYSHILQGKLGPQLDQESRLILERMSTAAYRMDRLIQDILAYSRIMRSEYQLGAHDLDDITSYVIEHYPEVKTADVRVKRPLGRAIGQESLLTQVISNLLGNAVKFVPKGVSPIVDVWTEKWGDKIRLTIQDNGIGIAQEHQARIFEPFERIESAERYSGTGIGLAIIKKAVEKMGGQVGLESAIGRGSLFWVDLTAA